MFNLIRLPLLPLSYSILFMVNDICFSNLCNNITVNFNAFWTTVNLLIYSIKLMCKSLLFSCMRIKIQGIFDISQYMFIESIIINQRPLLTYCKHILHICITSWVLGLFKGYNGMHNWIKSPWCLIYRAFFSFNQNFSLIKNN